MFAAGGLALGGGGAALVAMVTRDGAPRRPAHLRGTAPLPHAQVIALDLAVPVKMRAAAVRAAHKAVVSADGDGAAVWLGLGPGAVPDQAAGPVHLRAMPVFPGDVLESNRSHGDMLLQITASSAASVAERAGGLLDALSDWRVRWRSAGVRRDNRTADGRGLARNPFHFTEGYGNPAGYRAVSERALVRQGQGEPAWTLGGSYQVVRIIRLATDLWDRDSSAQQERIVGRRSDGRWLDGTPKGEEPNFAADPRGRITPLDAHVRRAAPDRRHPPPLVRRSYTYDHGNGDRGLIFSCFQRDLRSGFEAVQKRLQGEAMANYTLTVGGGYFFVPPPGKAWLSGLFTR